MEINYTSLTENKPKLIESDLTNLKNLDTKTTSIIVTLLASAILLMFHPLLPFLGLLIFYPLSLVYFNRNKKSIIRLSNFAVTNNFRYVSPSIATPSDAFKLSGVMSDIHNHSMSNQIIGTYKDFDFRIFCPKTMSNYTIMHVQLKNSYPHIVLDSIQNNTITNSIGRFFSERDRIHLGGNFRDVFKAYAKASPIDTLRILSPDMMSLMMDKSYMYDIEIYKNNLHIVSNFSYYNKKDISSLFEIADQLLNKLDRRGATVRASFDTTSEVS